MAGTATLWPSAAASRATAVSASLASASPPPSIGPSPASALSTPAPRFWPPKPAGMTISSRSLPPPISEARKFAYPCGLEYRLAAAPRSCGVAMIATLIGHPALRARLVSSTSACATPCEVGGEYGKKTSWLSRMSLAGSPSARAAGAAASAAAASAASRPEETRARTADIIAPRRGAAPRSGFRDQRGAVAPGGRGGRDGVLAGEHQPADAHHRQARRA